MDADDLETCRSIRVRGRETGAQRQAFAKASADRMATTTEARQGAYICFCETNPIFFSNKTVFN